MASAAILLHHIRRLVGAPALDGQPDRELLRRFTRDGDGQAFAALLRRHGPMAWAACRRVLPNTADAEDVLQKTFLLLAQKAAGLRDHDTVGGWLYGVAYRLALRARSEAAVRADREGRTPPRAPSDPLADITGRETQQLFDEALARLPERFRAVLVLCCLEGRTQGEAARQLGCSRSTLKRRLEEGRTRLGQQLVRQGVTLPAAALAGTLAPRADAALPPALTAAVLRAVTGAPVAGVVGRAVGGLLVSRRRFVVAALAIPVALAAGGVAYWAIGRPPGESARADSPPPDPADGTRPRFDLAGDPLPDGAIARIGTTRFRYEGRITSLAFTADGKRLFSFESSGADPRNPDGIRVWDLATGDEQNTRIAKEEKSHRFWHVSSISADGKLAATTDTVGAHIWDLTSGKKVKDLGHGWHDNDDGHGHTFDRPYLSPDGRVLALVWDYVVSTWDVATGKRLATWQPASHDYSLEMMFSLPDVKYIPFMASSLIIVADVNNVLHFRIFDNRNKKLVDTDESQLPAQKSSINELRKQLQKLRPPHELSASEKWQIITEVTSIVGHTPSAGASWPDFLAFTGDGKTLMTTTYGNGVFFWEAATGNMIRHLDGIDVRCTKHTALSADGKLIAGFSADRKLIAGFKPAARNLCIFDAADGKVLHQIDPPMHIEPENYTSAYGGVAFSPDGKALACGTVWSRPPAVLGPPERGLGGGVYLWDTATGKQLTRLAPFGPKDEYELGRLMAFSPDGTRLAVTLAAGGTKRLQGGPIWRRDLGLGPFWEVIQVYDVATGEELPSTAGLPSRASLAVLSPDGKTLATTCYGLRSIWLWDAATGKQRQRLEVQEEVSDLYFSADGRRLFYPDGLVLRCWDVATGRQLPHFGEGSGVLARSPDGKRLAVVSGRGVWVIDTTTGERVCEIPLGAGPATFLPDGQSLVVYDGRSLHVCDATTGKDTRQIDIPGDVGGVLARSPDGKRLAVSSGRRVGGGFTRTALWVIDTTTGERVEVHPPPGSGWDIQRWGFPWWGDRGGATFVPDGQSLVVVRDNRYLHVCDVTTGKDTRQTAIDVGMGPNEEPPKGWTFSPSGRHIASLLRGQIRVHQLPDGAEVCRFETVGYCDSFVWSPDGRTVACGSRTDPLVHVVDVATGKDRHTFAGHQGGVETLAFSADGKTLVSAGTDTTLLVWDLTAPQAAPGSGRPEKSNSPGKPPIVHQWRPTITTPKDSRRE